VLGLFVERAGPALPGPARGFRAAAGTGPDRALSGVAASPGVVRAKARVLPSEREWNRLQPGEIMVCPYTNPAWTPLFAMAAGVVTETGGAGAHAAIVAREYGIPAVMGVTGATTRIRDGQELLLDGSAGRVTLGEQ
jgi:rifampicin phosphotransferase